MKMHGKYTNLDADAGYFFERELEQVKAESYDVLYPDLLARDIFPLDTTSNPAATSVTYESYDQLGMARLLANYAQDLPNVEISGKEVTRKVYGEGAAFGYSVNDIRAAQMAGKPLSRRKAEAARRALLQLENKLAFEGDPATEMPNFVQNANFNQVTPVDGAGGTTDWASKTPDEIIADVTSMTSAIRDVSNGVEAPDTLLLPEKQFTLISTKPRSSTSDTTIFDFILKSNPFIERILAVYPLKDSAPVSASYDSEDAAVLYKLDRSKLWLETPQDVEMFEAQPKGLMWEVPCHMRTAGVIVAYPKSIATLYGI